MAGPGRHDGEDEPEARGARGPQWSAGFGGTGHGDGGASSDVSQDLGVSAGIGGTALPDAGAPTRPLEPPPVDRGRPPTGSISPPVVADAVAQDLRPGTVLAARYEVQALLGRGGMGAVYRVHDRLRGVDVALKVMLPSLMLLPKVVERFRREIDLMMELRHEGIVGVYDAGFDPTLGLRFYTMQLLEGCSLRTWLDERKRLGLRVEADEALAVVAALLDALRYAHARTVHRDLKPENIFLVGGEPGRARILDFGIAKLVGDERDLTRTNVALGTLDYMAPEQREDSARVDARADLYAVAVILYEMLTGRKPIGRFRTPAEEQPGLPRRLDEAILRGLETDPDRRYPSAERLLEEVVAIRALLARARPPAAGGMRRGPGGAARRAALAASAAAAIALAGYGVWRAIDGRRGSGQSEPADPTAVASTSPTTTLAATATVGTIPSGESAIAAAPAPSPGPAAATSTPPVVPALAPAVTPTSTPPSASTSTPSTPAAAPVRPAVPPPDVLPPLRLADLTPPSGSAVEGYTVEVRGRVEGFREHRLDHVRVRATPARVRLSAPVGPVEEVQVVFPVGGAVVGLAPAAEGDGAPQPFQVGDRVTKGQVLVVLAQQDFVARRDQAEAALAPAVADAETANRGFERARRLAESGAISPRALEEARVKRDAALAAVESRRAALADAEAALERSVLRAPIDGVILSRAVDVGEAARPGAPAFSIADLSILRARFEVPDEVAEALRAGDPLGVCIVGRAGVVFDGSIARISPVTVAAGGHVDVDVALPNPDGLLLPGMLASVEVARPDLPQHAPLDPATGDFRLVLPLCAGPNEVVIGAGPADGAPLGRLTIHANE